MSVSASVRRIVRERAGDACEYCLLSQDADEMPLQIEHIQAQQHGGCDDPDNLALACGTCNRRKGPNLTGVDAFTGEIVRLFHPRRDAWREHFAWDGLTIVGLTDVGRVTVQVLAMNSREQVETRRHVDIARDA